VVDLCEFFQVWFNENKQKAANNYRFIGGDSFESTTSKRFESPNAMVACINQSLLLQPMLAQYLEKTIPIIK
jgi:hypothetical protein